MPVLGVIAISAIAGFAGLFGGAVTNTALEHPASLPSGNSSLGNFDLTKLAAYGIAGALIFYFGKKIIK